MSEPQTPAHVHEIKLIGPQLCEVVVGPSRRVYISNRRAVGLALLQDASIEEETAVSTRAMTWTDMLPSHGVAVGVNGRERVVVAVVPEVKRTIQWTGLLYRNRADGIGHHDQHQVEAVFPPCLVMLRTQDVRYKKAFLFCVKPDALKTLSVTGGANVLASFPYGNVYASGGRICWGTVPHSTLNTVDDVLHTFFGSGFNPDLFVSSPCGVPARNLPELVSFTKGVLPSPTAPYFNMSISTQIRTLLGSETE